MGNSIENGFQFNGFCEQCHENYRCCPRCLEKDKLKKVTIVINGLCVSCYRTAREKRIQESIEGEYVAHFDCEKCHNSIENGLQFNGFCEPCHEKYRCCPRCLKKDKLKKVLIVKKGFCAPCYQTVL